MRTDGDSTTLVSILRREIGAAGKNILITDVMTLQQQIDASLLQERLVSTLSAFFGALALLLSAIGLYGVVSYAVVQRTNEIGIRMALGAGTGGVVWMVLRESLALAGIGVLIGVPAAALAVQPMASLLFGLKPADPATFATGAVLLLTTAAVASYLPARRAARIDPIRALREE